MDKQAIASAQRSTKMYCNKVHLSLTINAIPNSQIPSQQSSCSANNLCKSVPKRYLRSLYIHVHCTSNIALATILQEVEQKYTCPDSRRIGDGLATLLQSDVTHNLMKLDLYNSLLEIKHQPVQMMWSTLNRCSKTHQQMCLHKVHYI